MSKLAPVVTKPLHNPIRNSDGVWVEQVAGYEVTPMGSRIPSSRGEGGQLGRSASDPIDREQINIPIGEDDVEVVEIVHSLFSAEEKAAIRAKAETVEDYYRVLGLLTRKRLRGDRAPTLMDRMMEDELKGQMPQIEEETIMQIEETGSSEQMGEPPPMGRSAALPSSDAPAWSQELDRLAKARRVPDVPMQVGLPEPALKAASKPKVRVMFVKPQNEKVSVWYDEVVVDTQKELLVLAYAESDQAGMRYTPPAQLGPDAPELLVVLDDEASKRQIRLFVRSLGLNFSFKGYDIYLFPFRLAE